MKKIIPPSQQTTDEIGDALEEGRRILTRKPTNFTRVLSTGSTLLDLAISGGRVSGGGIPGGIMMEVSGLESVGKTAILAEVIASTQNARKKGAVLLMDPESRFDEEYAEIYGVKIDYEHEYCRPDTVEEMFEAYEGFNPNKEKYPGISVVAADSLAALSTRLEMEDQDKMGMRRAKMFSEGLRKFARMIAQPNRLLICSNQVREGEQRHKTPGGIAVRFYSSVRIEMRPGYPKNKITREKKLKSGKEVSKVIGIITSCRIIKSSIDDPFREAPVYIVFGYGIDDIRANLQWWKDMTRGSQYDAAGLMSKPFRSIDRAIQEVEEQGLEAKLRMEVIGLWEEIEDEFKTNRPTKKR